MSKPTTCPPVADPTPGAPHNNLAALPRWVAVNPTTSGRLSHLEVMHDPWCGIHHGHRCHCEPEFRWAEGPAR